MLSRDEATVEIRRMEGLDGYPHAQFAPEAELELIEYAQRARSLEHLRMTVDGWIRGYSAAPKPAELMARLRGPEQPTGTPPGPTRCVKCGDSGWEPIYVLRTARPKGAGYEVEALTKEQYEALDLPRLPLRQSAYSAVRRCTTGCRIPAPRGW